MITLTDAERDRFAAYLEQEARSNDALAKQLESLGPAHAAGVKKYRMEAAACVMIMRRFRNTESFTVVNP